MKSTNPKITFRQKLILDLLQDQKHLAIKELPDRLGLSPATVYREINRLVAAGYAERVPGGVVLPGGVMAGANVGICLYCRIPISSRSQVVLEFEDGEKAQACCPHCGLMGFKSDRPVVSALAADFIYGRMTNMRQAFYVVESSVILCCSPSTLCFQSTEDAARYQRGFGGQVLNFAETRHELLRLMQI